MADTNTSTPTDSSTNNNSPKLKTPYSHLRSDTSSHSAFSSGRSSPAFPRRAINSNTDPTTPDSSDSDRPSTPSLQAHARSIQHGLNKKSHRHSGTPFDCYIGLAFRVLKSREEIDRYKRETGSVSRSVVNLEGGEELLTWQAVVSDGVGTIDSGRDATTLKVTSAAADKAQDWKMVKHVAERLVRDAMEVAEGKSLTFQIVAICEPLPEILANCPIFLPTIWQHLNAIPFLIPSPTNLFHNLPDPDPEFFASHAVSTSLRYLHPAIHSAVTVTCSESTRLVEVDAGGKIRIASLEGYRQSSSGKVWRRLMALVRHVRGRGIRWVRVSATPQGGGVALLQNALVRLWKCLGIEDHGTWLVPLGHPSVFEITKKKFHNVLQGVAADDVKLDAVDEKYFEVWMKSNYKKFWKDTGVLTDRILVADDPQVVPLIPRIKSDFPSNPIIFRSHIQIRSDLTDTPGTEQAHVWDYLFKFIRQADVFLAHPVDEFVPKSVRDGEEPVPVMYMPPSTDPLDGLNKPLGWEAVRDIRAVYNNISAQQCGVVVDWDRGYVLQVARFDPSKGLPDLLAGYLEFRQKLEDAGKGTDKDGKEPPMLIVVGHGSIDDPDGTRIYEELHQIVNSDPYSLITPDVSIVRAPPSDTLLGCLMQGAWCATQLSTREGFESKVSEAVLKRVPIIASRAGGIPLQVKDGVNGWLVDPAAPSQVAKILYDFYTGSLLLDRRQGRPDDEYSQEDPPLEDDQHRNDDDEMPRTDRKPNPDHTTHPQVGDPGLVGESDGDSSIKEGKRLNPNDTADQFVKTIGAPFPMVKPTPDGPSEDFFTVGNAVKWLWLFSIISGKGINPSDHTPEKGYEGEGDGEEEVELLKSMGLGMEDGVAGRETMRKWEGRAVWECVMGGEMDEGEGRVIWRGEKV